MKRLHKVVNEQYDATDFTSYSASLGPFRLELYNFWDVASRLYYSGRCILFTSPSIHPRLNRIAEWLYRREDEKYDEQQSDDNQAIEFCWHCGETDIRVGQGYAGEEILYCPNGHLLYEEDPTSYII